MQYVNAEIHCVFILVYYNILDKLLLEMLLLLFILAYRIYSKS